MSPAADSAEPLRRARPLLVLLAALGAVAFLYGISRPQPAATWGIYLVNLLFWSSLAITGPAVAGMIQMTEGRWSPGIKRLALTTAGFLPVSFVLFLVLFLGRAVLYPWVTTPVPVRAAWLNVPFMSLRIGLGVLGLYAVALTFVRAVLDEPRAGGDRPEAVARRTRLATIMLMLYVVVLSLWGFDLVMSLDPYWYSGLLGGYYVVTSLYTGFGLVTFLAIRANARNGADVSHSAIQDIAKLTFAMCIMWMYFFFSQYLVIWYGNVPVETKFFLRRFFVDPWRTLAFVIFIAGALIPFCYLLKRLTGRPPTRHKVFTVILFMGWIAVFLERIMLVFPSMSTDNTLPLGPVGLLITAGFFSLFVLSRHWFLARHPAASAPAP
jgi:Ni/Fe-hydrogenase subunit HybB-like protein